MGHYIHEHDIFDDCAPIRTQKYLRRRDEISSQINTQHYINTPWTIQTKFPPLKKSCNEYANFVFTPKTIP
jgi:hypothetical protein